MNILPYLPFPRLLLRAVSTTLPLLHGFSDRYPRLQWVVRVGRFGRVGRVGRMLKVVRVGRGAHHISAAVVPIVEVPHDLER